MLSVVIPKQSVPVSSPVPGEPSKVFSKSWWLALKALADAVNELQGGQGVDSSIDGQTANELLIANRQLTRLAPAADGDRLFEFVAQDGTGGWTITWDTTVFVAGTLTLVDLTPLAITVFEFVGVGAGGKWQQVGQQFSVGAGMIETVAGDLTGALPTPTVRKINGTLLSGLATGILKNTTATGVPSIAVYADLPLPGAWTAYTPALTTTMGTAGISTDAAWRQTGKDVTVRIDVAVTLSGVASPTIAVSLPVAPKVSAQLLAAQVVNGLGNEIAIGEIAVGSGILHIYRNLGVNFTIGVLTFTIQGTYEAA